MTMVMVRPRKKSATSAARAIVALTRKTAAAIAQSLTQRIVWRVALARASVKTGIHLSGSCANMR